MQNIKTIRDLERHGIDALTGEADQLGFRILCDVTDKGRRIVCDALGLPPDTAFHANWNSGPADDPHVGSFMLSPLDLTAIAIFALAYSGAIKVAVWPGQIVGWFPEDEHDANGLPWQEVLDTYTRIHGTHPHPCVLTHNIRSNRHTHAMSGRTF